MSLSFTRRFYSPHPSTTHLYPLSLHDALPISLRRSLAIGTSFRTASTCGANASFNSTRSKSAAPSPMRLCSFWIAGTRSEEHTSELQSLRHLVCRLLLEKKKKKMNEQKSTTVR